MKNIKGHTKRDLIFWQISNLPNPLLMMQMNARGAGAEGNSHFLQLRACCIRRERGWKPSEARSPWVNNGEEHLAPSGQCASDDLRCDEHDLKLRIEAEQTSSPRRPRGRRRRSYRWCPPVFIGRIAAGDHRRSRPAENHALPREDLSFVDLLEHLVQEQWKWD
jgi:hypothetical protein